MLVLVSLELELFIFRMELLQYVSLSSLNHIHFHVLLTVPDFFFHSLSLIIVAVYCKNKGDSEEDVQGIKSKLRSLP